MPGKRFALIVDEAHSPQSGESTKSLKAVLSPASLEEAEREESGAETPEEALENAILAPVVQRFAELPEDERQGFRSQLTDYVRLYAFLAQVVRNGLGARAGTCIDPRTQMVDGKAVCVVSCRRSPESVFLVWKGVQSEADGDFFVRSGPGTLQLSPTDTRNYIRSRVGAAVAQ